MTREQDLELQRNALIKENAKLVRALEYCAYAPGELAPANQAQYLVARAALAVMREANP